MKSRTGKIALSVITLILGILSACIGFGLLGGSTLGLGMRFIYGFCFIATPILIAQMIIALFK